MTRKFPISELELRQNGKKIPELSLNDYVAVFPAECPANPWTVSGGCTTFNNHQLGEGIQEVVARNECGCVCGQPC
jgi:hypothetical protein